MKIQFDQERAHGIEGFLIDGQITSDGSLALIETNAQEIDYFERPVSKRDWKIRMLRADQDLLCVELKSLPLIPSHVDLFSDGTILIVQGRCVKDGAYIEKNARHYSVDGTLLKQFTLGDGIASVQIDESDTIWVSYFDEGVFGNFGWDETPLGSDGLLAFNRLGEKLWSASGYEVADCYALNVKNAANVYFYYYDSFRFIHLANYAEVASYNVKGEDTIDQFVIVGNDILAVVDAHSVMHYEVKNHTIKPKGPVDFVNGKGKRIKGTVYMRGGNVYLITKEMVYWKGVQGFL